MTLRHLAGVPVDSYLSDSLFADSWLGCCRVIPSVEDTCTLCGWTPSASELEESEPTAWTVWFHHSPDISEPVALICSDCLSSYDPTALHNAILDSKDFLAPSKDPGSDVSVGRARLQRLAMQFGALLILAARKDSLSWDEMKQAEYDWVQTLMAAPNTSRC
jgi:hypothetical protein